MTPDENHLGELADNDLDRLLAAANEDLLTHIEAAADPTSALTAITVRTIPTGAKAQRRRQPFRPGWPIAVAAAIVLAIVGPVAFLAGNSRAAHSGGTGAVNVAASSPVTPSAARSPSTSSPSAAQPPGAAAMAAIGADLAQSASVRPTVQAAIANVQNCSESPSSGEATLQQAITTRQKILQGLPTLDVSGLPNGAQLVSALTTAIQNSLNAENDYRAWLADMVGSGNACGSNPSQDSNYVAAGTADSAATTSKEAFVAIWNPMAPSYGLQTYTDTGF